MDALIPVVIGGLIAVIGGLVGAGIQARREHRKWLREKRLDAYIPTLAFLTEYELFLTGRADHQSRVDGVLPFASDEEKEHHREALAPLEAQAMEYRDRVPREMAAISVLGPESLAEAARKWEETSRTKLVPWWEVGKGVGPIIAQMRKALDIEN